MNPDLIELQLVVTADYIPTAAQIQSWVTTALNTAAPHLPQQHTLLTVRITDEAESAALNHTWRHKDGPTNVLSFPFDAPEGVPAEALEPYLGDLVICAPLVWHEAREQGKVVTAHWAHLVVHGILHLLGYEHSDEPQAEEMETLEIEILAASGYPNPYEASDLRDTIPQRDSISSRQPGGGHV